MYRRVLVPLDGSKLSEETIPYAREVAIGLGLDLDFLRVAEVGESQASQVYVDEVAASVRDQIQRRKAITTDTTTLRPAEIRSQVVGGYPAEEILKYAEENPIDIILMATHGASNIHRWAIGSVAYKVLHASQIPVLLIRSGVPQETVYDQWPQRTILVPLDGSRLAESALPLAEALAKERDIQNTRIVLLSVYAPKTPRENYDVPGDNSFSPDRLYFSPLDVPPATPSHYTDLKQAEVDRAREQCEKYLNNITDELISKGIKAEKECIMGKPAEEIIKYANSHPFQVIVMTSHGHSGFKHLVLGSVAEKVVLEAHTPILIVKPEDGKCKGLNRVTTDF